MQLHARLLLLLLEVVTLVMLVVIRGGHSWVGSSSRRWDALNACRFVWGRSAAIERLLWMRLVFLLLLLLLRSAALVWGQCQGRQAEHVLHLPERGVQGAAAAARSTCVSMCAHVPVHVSMRACVRLCFSGVGCLQPGGLRC